MAVRTDPGLRSPTLAGVTGLLRKDLAVFVPRDRFLIGLIYLLGHPTVLPNEEAFFWLGIAIAGALVCYVPTIEWHQETDRMLSSLPVRRATVVFSRYLSSVLACGIAGMAWISTGIIIAPLLDPSPADPGMWTTFEGILAFFSVAGSLVALFLPLYFRLGLGRGAMAFVASSFALYVAVSIPSGLVIPGAAVTVWIGAMTSSIGPGWVLFLMLGGLAALLAASGRLSVHWLEKRDL